MKKTMKKFLCTVLVVVMCLTSVPLQGFIDLDWNWLDFNVKASALAETGQCGDNVYWDYNSETGELIISGTGNMWSFNPSSTPFHHNNITTVFINNGVKSIGDFMFFACNNLTSINIPNSVTNIAEAAFANCSNLSNVYAESIEGWINISFESNDSNPMYYADELYFGNTLATNITIPTTVSHIANYAFYSCESITSIIIPNNVISIGYSAFSNCHNLTSITISNALTNISYGTFENCYDLIKIEIPSSVTSIGEDAFFNCESLTSITIPNSVTSIGEEAFCSCDNLKYITIPGSVTNIGKSAFSFCENLENVTILDGVTNISSESFYCCDNLTSIIIPTSVTTIDSDAFYNCNELTDVHYTGKQADWDLINISLGNDSLTNANIHYNSTGSDDNTTPDDPNKPNDTDDIPTITAITGILEDYKATTVVIINGSGGYEYVTEITVNGKKYTVENKKLISVAVARNFKGREVTIEVKNDVVVYFETVDNEEHIPWHPTDHDPSIRCNDTSVEYYQKAVDFDKRKKFEITGNISNRDEVNELTDISITIKSPNADKVVFKTQNGYEASVTFPLGRSIGATNSDTFKCDAYIKRQYSPVSGSENLLFECILHGKINGKEVNKIYSMFNVKITNKNYKSDSEWTQISLMEMLDILFDEKYINKYPGRKTRRFNNDALELKSLYWNVKIATGVASLETLSEELNKCMDIAVKIGADNSICGTRFMILDTVTEYAEDAFLDYLFTKIKSEFFNISAFRDSELKKLLSSEIFSDYLNWYSNEVGFVNGNKTKVSLRCPIDIHVTDADNLDILKITDYNIKEYDEFTSAYISGDEKIIYLPTDLNHKIKIIATDNGSMDYIVESINDNYEKRIIEYNDIPLTKNKSYTSIVPADTSSTVGLYDLISDSGTVIKSDNEQIEHKYEVNTIHPTCTSEGYTTYTCYCGDTYTETIEANGHTDSEWIVDSNSTCAKEGSKHIECTVCEEVLKTEAIAKLPHKYSSVVTEATCEKGGYTTYTCTCGDTYTGDKTPAKGHDYAEGVCKNCGDSKVNNCSCNCHKSGLMGFIWKLLRFFYKLFGSNKICSCGVSHY